MELYIMIGIPGSGKSTWARNKAEEIGTTYISRDDIRFSSLGAENKYFDKEKEVYKTYINKIQNCINNNKDCIVDATHIDSKSRNKLKRNLKLNKNIDIIAVNVITNVNVCICRNKLRQGLKQVPNDVILSMENRKNFVEDFNNDNEKFHYNKIINIYNDHEEVKSEKFS